MHNQYTEFLIQITIYNVINLFPLFSLISNASNLKNEKKRNIIFQNPLSACIIRPETSLVYLSAYPIVDLDTISLSTDGHAT